MERSPMLMMRFHCPLEAGMLRQLLQGLVPTEKPLIKLLILFVHIVEAIVPSKTANAGVFRQQPTRSWSQKPTAAYHSPGPAPRASSFLGEKTQSHVVGAVQLFPFQHRVRGNMNAEDRSLRLYSLWLRPWPHPPIFKFQRPQPEQQPASLPPCPKSPVKGPLPGAGVGLLQKAPEAVHGGQKIGRASCRERVYPVV